MWSRILLRCCAQGCYQGWDHSALCWSSSSWYCCQGKDWCSYAHGKLCQRILWFLPVHGLCVQTICCLKLVNPLLMIRCPSGPGPGLWPGTNPASVHQSGNQRWLQLPAVQQPPANKSFPTQVHSSCPRCGQQQKLIHERSRWTIQPMASNCSWRQCKDLVGCLYPVARDLCWCIKDQYDKRSELFVGACYLLY